MLRSDQSVLAQRMQSTRLPRTTTQAAIEEKAGAHGGDSVAAALAVARAEQSNRVQHSIARWFTHLANVETTSAGPEDVQAPAR